MKQPPSDFFFSIPPEIVPPAINSQNGAKQCKQQIKVTQQWHTVTLVFSCIYLFFLKF